MKLTTTATLLTLTTVLGLAAITFGVHLKNSIEQSVRSVEDLTDSSFEATSPRTLKSEAKEVKVKSLDINVNRIVPLVGEIGDNALGVASAIQKLAAVSKAPIYLVINSPGGSVVDGASILSAMRGSRAPVYTVCLQLCASMAFITFEYGVKRYIVDMAVIMSHPAAGGARGEIDKMVSQLTTVQKYVDDMNREVARKSNVSYDDLKRRSSIEMWLAGKDAVLQGYADAVIYLPTLSGAGVELPPSVENFKISVPDHLKVTW